MTKNNEIRVWVDGCYDMVHFGHANSLRQAKELGNKLVVGIHSDAEIAKYKRPPVLTEDERHKLLNGIKWVDEVVKNAPYVTSLEVMNEHDCDFCVHGDDITTDNDGNDTYEKIKQSGKYKEVPRTQGISTTGLIKRILSMNEHDSELTQTSSWTGSDFIPTVQKLIQFGNGTSPKLNDRIVYTAGIFDLFHVGHLDFLEKAKALGNYLIVGVHHDPNSIMNIYERTMNVLACKYVDDVVMEAPYKVTQDLMKHLKIDIVCHGKEVQEEFYEVPKEMKKFTIIDSGNDMTTEKIKARVVENRQVYNKRNTQKEAKEIEIQKSLMKDSIAF